MNNQRESDPFHRFMFGNVQADTDRSHSTSNRDWLFGGRHETKSTEPISMHSIHSIEQWMNNVDYMEIMEHVDNLMVSTNELRPLLQKAKPYLNGFLSSTIIGKQNPNK